MLDEFVKFASTLSDQQQSVLQSGIRDFDFKTVDNFRVKVLRNETKDLIDGDNAYRRDIANAHKKLESYLK